MKEKMIQYKWILAIVGIVILNFGWIIYTKGQMKQGILIEDRPIEPVAITTVEEQVQTQNVSEITSNNIEVSLEEPKLEVLPNTEEAEKNAQVPVYICGEVLRAGVYYVEQDAIINDVIECAGGLTREADETLINLASPIRPNEKIIVPKQGEEIDKNEDSYENRERIETLPSSESNLHTTTIQSEMSRMESAHTSGLININSATKSELMSLSGIGEVKAQAIIAYREEQGGFKNIEEIMQISGIGEKTFEKLKPLITT